MFLQVYTFTNLAFWPFSDNAGGIHSRSTSLLNSTPPGEDSPQNLIGEDLAPSVNLPLLARLSEVGIGFRMSTLFTI